MIALDNLDWAVSRTLHALAVFAMPVVRRDLAGILVHNTATLADDAQLDSALQTIREMGLLAGDSGARSYDLHPDVKVLVRNSLGPVGCSLSDRTASDYVGALPVRRGDEIHGLDEL